MTIEIDNQYHDSPVQDYEEIIYKVIETSLDYEECPYEAQVEVHLMDNEEIREINQLQRGIDKPTDVLSFPMTDFPVPGDFSDLEERDPEAFHPDSGELILGDILISMDQVVAQALEYGHSTVRELAFLVAHSMLHLMGYDHMSKEEADVMEKKQEEILKICGYTRGVI